MAYSKVGSVWIGTQSGTTNSSLALASQTLSNGNLVVVGFGIKSTVATATSLTVTDGSSNTYTILGTPVTFGAAPPYLIAGIAASIITTGAAGIVITVAWNATQAGAAVAQATQWTGGGGTTGSNANDQISAAGGTGTSMSASTSPTTKSQELVIAWNAVNGTPTLSAQAFTPAGTSFTVPETMAQTTGTDNIAGQMSETLASSTGAQSYAATTTAAAWGLVIATFIPPTDTFPPKHPQNAYLGI